jgi:hypothetical protein
MPGNWFAMLEVLGLKGAHYQFLSPQNEQLYMTPGELLPQTTLKITAK